MTRHFANDRLWTLSADVADTDLACTPNAGAAFPDVPFDIAHHSGPTGAAPIDEIAQVTDVTDGVFTIVRATETVRDGTQVAQAWSTGDLIEHTFTAGAVQGLAVTVQDEGTPLATIADTLDFVGAGVTASGTGTTKTITIPGGGNTSGQFIVGFDGGGSALASGKMQDIQAPFSGTITGWTILADVSGSAVVDIWKTAYAGYPPTVADSITASAKPTLAAASDATSSALTGWTTAVVAGDTLRFHLDSVSACTRLLLVIAYSRP
jgi:hypothetical protein